MIDGAEVYEATKAAFIDAMADMKNRPVMMRIEPFDAEDDGGDPVRVVGIIDDDESFIRFVVIEEGEDGEIYPIVRSTIYRKGTAAAAAVENKSAAGL